MQEFQATKTLTYENGDRSPTLFSKEEYEKRLSSLRKQMAEAKLDAVVLTSVHNIAYFSNFVYCAFGRPYALVVTPEKNVTITPLVDAGQPWRDNLSLRSYNLSVPNPPLWHHYYYNRLKNSSERATNNRRF